MAGLTTTAVVLVAIGYGVYRGTAALVRRGWRPRRAFLTLAVPVVAILAAVALTAIPTSSSGHGQVTPVSPTK
jgi:multisubunit Na+/H+ antiporter MnhB subunit